MVVSPEELKMKGCSAAWQVTPVIRSAPPGPISRPMGASSGESKVMVASVMFNRPPLTTVMLALMEYSASDQSTGVSMVRSSSITSPTTLTAPAVAMATSSSSGSTVGRRNTLVKGALERSTAWLMGFRMWWRSFRLSV